MSSGSHRAPLISPSRWIAIEPLLDAALDLPSDQRQAFLASACRGDEILRAEVEALLTDTAHPDDELDSGAGAVCPALLDDEAMSPLDLPPVLAGRYRIASEIGHGGMAVIYLAFDERLKRQVAIKVLRPEARLQMGVERFSEEIRLTANLRHPNIVPLFDAGDADGCTFFVMPYIEGDTLRERVAAVGRHSMQDAVRIASDVLAALEHAHAAGVVHRDVKPSNIMFAGHAALLSDFGIARATKMGEQGFTETGLIVGTPAYMSPEQHVVPHEVGPASDIYSLGCVLWELLTGEPPVSAATRLAMAEFEVDPVQLPPERSPSVSLAVTRCVQQAIALDPAERFASASAFANALSAAVRHDEGVGSTGDSADREPRPHDEGSRSNSDVHAAPLAPVQASSAPAWPKRRSALVAGLGIATLGVIAGWMRWYGDAPLDAKRVVVFPISGGGELASDTAFGIDVKDALLGALTSTGYLKPLDAIQLEGMTSVAATMTATPNARRSAVTSVRAGFAVEGRWERSDSIRLRLVVRDAKQSEVTRGFALPLSASAWTVGLRAANELLPSLISVNAPKGLALPRQLTPAVAASFLQGERAYRSARFAEALDFFRAAVREDSTFAHAALRGAQAASWTGQTPAAARFVATALRDTLALPLELRELARGFDAYLRADGDSAVKHLKAALALDEQSPEAWMALGEVYTHLLPRDAPLDSLAEAAFLRVRQLDRHFVPVIYHLIEFAVRKDQRDRADTLLRAFAAAGGDSTELLPAEIMVRCARASPTGVRWQQYSAVVVLEAARALTVGGLRHVDCAQAAWEHAFTVAPAAYRWGALQGLQGVLVAQGKFKEAETLLEGDSTVNRTLREWMYTLAALGGAGDSIPARAAAAAGETSRFFAVDPSSTGSTALWHLGLWLTHKGQVTDAQVVADTLRVRALGSVNSTLQYFERSISARVALARGDTATARTILAALRSTADRQSLTWNPWDAQGVDRLLLAELALARRDFASASATAMSFDAGASVSFAVFLWRSLQIRIQASEALGDELSVRSLRGRLDRLRRTKRLPG